MHIWNHLQRKKSLKLVAKTSDRNQFSYFYVLNSFLKLIRPDHDALWRLISRTVLSEDLPSFNAMHLLVDKYEYEDKLTWSSYNQMNKINFLLIIMLFFWLVHSAHHSSITFTKLISARREAPRIFLAKQEVSEANYKRTD